MVHSRLHNNHAVKPCCYIEPGNRLVLSCLVNNMQESSARTTENVNGFLPFIVSELCCACETDIVMKLRNSLDVRTKLLKSGELSEVGELVEKATLDLEFQP